MRTACSVVQTLWAANRCVNTMHKPYEAVLKPAAYFERATSQSLVLRRLPLCPALQRHLPRAPGQAASHTASARIRDRLPLVGGVVMPPFIVDGLTVTRERGQVAPRGRSMLWQHCQC